MHSLMLGLVRVMILMEWEKELEAVSFQVGVS